MHIELLILGLLALAVLVAFLARRLRLPYTVALVATGLVLRAANLFEPPVLTGELLYAVFLPGLVFEAAFQLDARAVWANRRVLAMLAVPGVVASALLTAAVLVAVTHGLGLLPGFGWRHGLVFGALIAATDPIAVIALFRSLGAPARLTLILDGESLLNDGTAVVLFIVLLPLASGGDVSLAAGAGGFVAMVGGAVILGAVIGLLAALAIQRVGDVMLQICLTVLCAYGSFVLAERLHVSGIIATLAAGLACGSQARPRLGPEEQGAFESFWSFVAFVLNSMVFLLLGLTVELRALVGAWPVALVGWVAVLVARGAMVGAVTAAVSRTTERLPRSWATALALGGLRGALSLVLALGLATDTEQRAVIVGMTVGVVVLSIVVQGLAAAPVLRGLGLVGRSSPGS
jgi:CPA1 family monovalent cation:H+ antiporter